MGFIPKRHQLLPCAWFYPVNDSICSQWYHLQWRLLSVATVMSVYLPSYLSCLINFTDHIQLYSRTKSYLHPYIHAFIHTFIHQYFSRSHTFMCIQHIHNVILTWLHQSPRVLFGCILSFQSSLIIVSSNSLQPLFIFLCQVNSLQLPFCYFCAKLIACKNLYIPLRPAITFESGW